MKKIISIFILIALSACSYIQNGPAEAKPLSAAEKEAILRATPQPNVQTKSATKTKAKAEKKATAVSKTTAAPKAEVQTQKKRATAAVPKTEVTTPKPVVPSVSPSDVPSRQPIYQHPGQAANNKDGGSLFNFGK